MPQYNPPFTKPQLLMKGVPAWLLGSFNLLRGNCSGTVADTALATGTGTVTVQINNGPIPLVGDYISVWGTALQSGLFNISRAKITAVSITATTGAGTISYALTGSTQSVTADPGRFTTEPAEQAEALANNSSSIPCCIQAPEGDSQFTVPIAVTFPTMPTAVTVTLQRAIRDIDAEYTDVSASGALVQVIVAASAYTSGPMVQSVMERGYFYRLRVTGLSGSGTVVGKVG